MRKDIAIDQLMLGGEKRISQNYQDSMDIKISFYDKGLERSLIKCCNCNIFLLYLEI